MDEFEPPIRELLRAFPTMPATVIAERIGWPFGIRTLSGRVAELRPAYLPPDPAGRTGFIGAAALVGWLAERRWDRRPLLSLPAFFLASAIPFLIGVPYLGIALALMGRPVSFATLLQLGVTPFLLGGAIKWLVAALLFPLIWRLLTKRPESPTDRQSV